MWPPSASESRTSIHWPRFHALDHLRNSFAAFAAFSYRRLTKSDVSFRLAFAFLFLVIVSHGLFDAMTNGGKGVGFFSSRSRTSDSSFRFARIRVSPIGMDDLRRKPLWCAGSELRCVGTVRGWRLGFAASKARRRSRSNREPENRSFCHLTPLIGIEVTLLQFSPQREEMERFAEEVIPLVRGARPVLLRDARSTTAPSERAAREL